MGLLTDLSPVTQSLLAHLTTAVADLSNHVNVSELELVVARALLGGKGLAGVLEGVMANSNAIFTPTAAPQALALLASTSELLGHHATFPAVPVAR